MWCPLKGLSVIDYIFVAQYYTDSFLLSLFKMSRHEKVLTIFSKTSTSTEEISSVHTGKNYDIRDIFDTFTNFFSLIHIVSYRTLWTWSAHTADARLNFNANYAGHFKIVSNTPTSPAAIHGGHIAVDTWHFLHVTENPIVFSQFCFARLFFL